MAIVISGCSSLSETSAAFHSVFSFVGYGPSLTSGGTKRKKPFAMDLCLYIIMDEEVRVSGGVRLATLLSHTFFTDLDVNKDLQASTLIIFTT